MSLEILVDAPEFWSRLEADIAAARQSVYVQTLSFEADRAGSGLARSLTASCAPDRRVLVDAFTRFMINDRFLYTPGALVDTELQAEARATRAMIDQLGRAGVAVHFTNPVGLSLLSIAARNHKKIMALDRSVAYVGGINFSDHNFAWHDMMLRFDDADIAACLHDDVVATSAGRNLAGAHRFDGVELHFLDGRDNAAGFAVLLELIDGARRSIFVESPYATFPFFDRLRAAAERGVEVTLVAPEVNNWSWADEYVRWEGERFGGRLLAFPRMTHLKAMLIDGEVLVVGSSNFDYLSYRLHQELLVIIRRRDVIDAFRRRVQEPDVAASRETERPRVSDWRGRLRRWQIFAATELSAWAGRTAWSRLRGGGG